MAKFVESMSASEDLVNRALTRATGANIHRLGQLIALYRWCRMERPDAVGKAEDALRAFARTGRLQIPVIP